MGMWRQGEAMIISCLRFSATGAILCASLRSSDRWFDTLFCAVGVSSHIFVHEHTFGVDTVHCVFKGGKGGARVCIWSQVENFHFYFNKEHEIKIEMRLKSMKRFHRSGGDVRARGCTCARAG